MMFKPWIMAYQHSLQMSRCQKPKDVFVKGGLKYNEVLKLDILNLIS